MVGNYIASELVEPDSIVTFVPLIDSPTDSEKVSPELFPSCAGTRRQTTRVDSTVDVEKKSCEDKGKTRKSKRNIEVNEDKKLDTSLMSIYCLLILLLLMQR